ncbi:MAG: hypothetical protein ABI665_00645 [Vicinamibacterales bacterium]
MQTTDTRVVAGLKLLTAVEAAKAVTRLTGRKCSPRRVRHLLVDGGVGTELQPRQRGQTRLFGALDLAFLRLSLELERQGVSSWVSRVVLTYLRNELVLAWRAGSPVGLAVSGLRGTIQPALKPRPPRTVAWVPLREIWRGLDAEIGEVRTAQPKVWMWRDVGIHEVKRSTA